MNKIIDLLQRINLKDTLSDLEPCDVLFFCGDANRGVNLAGQSYSPLIDSVREEFEKRNYRCITIAHPWAKLIGKQAYGEPIAMNRSFFLALLQMSILKLGSNLKDIPLTRLYSRILEKTNPKLIIAIGSNNFLSKAARERNIYHLELLHGIGYNPIPWSWDKKEKHNLPQGILSLDEVSTQTFSPLKEKDIDIIQITHPFLSRFMQNEQKNIPKEWHLNHNQKAYKKEILVSLQWAFAGDHGKNMHLANILENGLFYNELEDVIRFTQDDILWRFRFHPVQYRNTKKYKHLFNYMENFLKEHSNCEWEDSTYLPLPSVLSACDGHLTMHSMSSYEAAYMGIKTLALCPIIREGGLYANMFGDLVDKGYVLKQPPAVMSILQWAQSVERTNPLLDKLDNDHWFDELLAKLPFGRN